MSGLSWRPSGPLPRVTPSAPAVRTHGVCSGSLSCGFPPPYLLIPPLAGATAAPDTAGPLSMNGVYLDNQAGVQFTLYELKQELKSRGHDINLPSLVDALRICSGVLLLDPQVFSG